MEKTVATLSPQEFEKLVERAVDKRMSVWLTQLLDAMGTMDEENEAPLQPEFVASLERSLEQARTGKTIDLNSFREQLAND